MLDVFRRSPDEVPFDQMIETKVFRAKGFDVVILDRKELTPIPNNAPIICMDDREKDVGIKLPGGITFEASYSTGGDKRGIARAVANAKDKGYTPTVHGDDHHGEEEESGCAYNAAWAAGNLSVPHKLAVSLRDVRRVVVGGGGRYDKLAGGHNADRLVLNTVKGMTTRPGLLAVDCGPMREIAGKRYEQALGVVADVVAGLKINQVGIIR